MGDKPEKPSKPLNDPSHRFFRCRRPDNLIGVARFIPGSVTDVVPSRLTEKAALNNRTAADVGAMAGRRVLAVQAGKLVVDAGVVAARTK